jgi:hypothetical protein
LAITSLPLAPFYIGTHILERLKIDTRHRRDGRQTVYGLEAWPAIRPLPYHRHHRHKNDRKIHQLAEMVIPTRFL